jgi:hypothetical protein
MVERLIQKKMLQYDEDKRFEIGNIRRLKVKQSVR